jgi:hypothetical protein
MSLSPEQIIALAPDAPSAKACRSLASGGKWPARGCDERAVWGSCQGSGREPYRTQIDLSEPAFRCTCPSRKFPCKHALGLFLLYATQQSSFESGARPAWVAEWLEKRDQQSQRGKGVGAEQAPDETAPPAQKKRATKVKRSSSERQSRVAAGLAELELWMRDLMRRGLAVAQTQPPRYWEQMAARLIDAQAPGAARRVREMSSVVAAAEGWADALLARVGSLFLAVEGFKRIETLPEPVRADLRTCLGWTVKEEELSAEGVRDCWLVTGQRTFEEDKLRVQRTWLWGEESGRDAALLEFAAPGQVLKSGLLVGTMIEAELVYYPSNYPLRAAVKQRHSAPVPRRPARGHTSAESLLDAYADALARNPWLEVFPALLDAVVPVRRDGAWLLRDADGRLLPISPKAAGGWKLLALGGGSPVTLFGEWDGRHLLPLCVWAEERYARI